MVSSLKFFNNLSNHQIEGGYYDAGSSLTGDKAFLSTLETVENTTLGFSSRFDGYIYTTWDMGQGGNYDYLEEVADLMRSRGRWPTN
jgi:hypothetical protein